MANSIDFTSDARRQLDRLDKPQKIQITRFILDRLEKLDNPRSKGDALKGPIFGDLWRYRVWDFRIIARIEDKRLVVLVVALGHRSDVYLPLDGNAEADVAKCSVLN